MKTTLGLVGLVMLLAGCSSALRAAEYEAMDQVDGVVPGHDPAAVALAVAPESHLASSDEEPIGGALLRSNRRGSRGWLKIQDGCDRKCSFCATRLARGASRSRLPEEIVAEARIQAHVHSELVLTGIHIGHYGVDLGEGHSLSALAAVLLELPAAVAALTAAIGLVQVLLGAASGPTTTFGNRSRISWS